MNENNTFDTRLRKVKLETDIGVVTTSGNSYEGKLKGCDTDSMIIQNEFGKNHVIRFKSIESFWE